MARGGSGELEGIVIRSHPKKDGMRLWGRREGGKVLRIDDFRPRQPPAPMLESIAAPSAFGATAGDAGPLGGRDAAYLVQQCLSSEDGSLRKASLDELASRKDWRSLIACMSSGHGDIASGALERLSAMRLRSELLEYRQRSADPRSRHNAMRVLEAQADSLVRENDAAPLFALANSSEDAGIRMKVARHFVESGNRAAVEHLASSAFHPDVRDFCLASLAKDFRRYRGNLNMMNAFAAHSADRELRRKAMDALASLGMKGNLQVIGSKSLDEDDRTYALALAGRM